ncbi:MAG: hypothetical protein HY658_06600 [Actinobacteria bacterium]|nr:hypothetical protein [Actinomycetota bacterium]
MSRIAASGAVVAAFALLLTACGKGVAEPAASAGEDPWRRTVLRVVQGDRTTPFENGTAVRAGAVDVEIFVAPYPPAREGSIDLLVSDPATGLPVEDGAVDVSFDMYMPHGVISAQALPGGAGHALVPYKLVMPGEWRMDIRISRDGDVALLALVFQVD